MAAAPAAACMTSLLGHELAACEALATAAGLPAFRGRQLFAWIFARRAPDFAAMSELPQALRGRLAAAYTLARPRQDGVVVATDGTRKYRFLAVDGGAFEAVFIPEVARGRGTHTLCISSQTGCAVGCKFCFTASLRRARSLTAAEIVGQVLAVQDDLATLTPGRQVTNIVFMGMGEPLLNFDAVVRACRILMHPLGMAFASHRITISTAGIVPRIAALGAALPTQLAISLNAANDATRTRIMPINKKWPLATLLAAMRAYPLRPRRRITVEYVLLAGVNDHVDDARDLARLLREIPVKINLLPLNPHARTAFTPPDERTVQRFQDVLRGAGYNVLRRTARGERIAAACGQLGESSGGIDPPPTDPAAASPRQHPRAAGPAATPAPGSAPPPSPGTAPRRPA